MEDEPSSLRPTTKTLLLAGVLVLGIVLSVNASASEVNAGDGYYATLYAVPVVIATIVGSLVWRHRSAHVGLRWATAAICIVWVLFILMIGY